MVHDASFPTKSLLSPLFRFNPHFSTFPSDSLTSVLCASYIGPGVIVRPTMGLLLVLGLDCVQCYWHIVPHLRIHPSLHTYTHPALHLFLESSRA